MSGHKNIEGASVGRNGYEINVKWYTQKVVGVIEFVIEDNPTIMQSNSDSVLVGFDDYMHQVHGSRTSVPRRRTVQSNHMGDFGLFLARVNLQTSEGDWCRREFGNMWRMNTQVRYEAVNIASLD